MKVCLIYLFNKLPKTRTVVRLITEVIHLIKYSLTYYNVISGSILHEWFKFLGSRTSLISPKDIFNKIFKVNLCGCHGGQCENMPQWNMYDHMI